MILLITKITGSPTCITDADGQKVFSVIEKAVKKRRYVTVSFRGVNHLTTTFLDAAIGQVVRLEEQRRGRFVSYTDVNHQDIDLILRVIKNAEDYFYKKEQSDGQRSKEGSAELGAP